MKLSDVMSAAGLASYAEVGLTIFFVVFVAIAIRTYRRGREQEFAHMAELPLESDAANQTSTHSVLANG